jgi:hypothetical protein
MRGSIFFCAALALAGCSRGDATPQRSSAPAPSAPGITAPGQAASANVTLAVAPAAGGSLDAAAGKPFGAPCVGDAECAGAVCFHKRIKGPDAGKEHRGGNDPVEHDGYCSLRCSDDADCPVPPTKGRCGARGMCKRLD